MESPDVVFAPPGERWQRVSPRLATVRRISLAVGCALPVGLGVLAAVLTGWWWALLVSIAGLLVLAYGWWLIGRQVPAWGYAEREDDLLVTHGLLFKALVVVPYGRMQFVDVQAGPLERRYGLATVQLHTASPATDARIPGLPDAEAARLRDRLAALGEARAAGL
ncbi:MAG TPA: PH domain-containing protein [Jiangellales bacterium]|nr:PH domain-containing protein [Jiangellales bacterium]